ncbi:sensor domain-containing diguanylate cyclase [Methylobacterium sp. A54F]
MFIRNKLHSLAARTRSPYWLAISSLLLVAGLCAVSAAMLWDMRIDAGQRSRIASTSLVRVLGRDIARNIEMYDLSLRAIVDGMKLPAVAQAAPDIRHMILFDRATTAENFGHTLVFDAAGKLLLSSRSLDVPDMNYADREYFQYHATHADLGLHISGPVTSRLTGRRVLILSRRLSNPDGSFTGVALGSVYLDYFRQLFAAAGADQIGTVVLYGPGGTIVMRSPYDEDQIGRNVEATKSYQRILTAKEGSFTGPSMIAEGARQFVFTHVGDLPLQLSISISPHEIYAEWRGKAVGLGAVVLGLCGLILILTWWLLRELAQRKAAEQATATLNAELQQLATTDALTGLRNRRRFDEVLSREWQRAIRTCQPLSVLLLDADHFKRFNDRYGHQQGDEALRLIAGSITAALCRPCDTAYRIGGEEFAVLLPDTSEIGAKVVAARIREGVEGCRLPHADNPHSVVTISAGIASSSAVSAQEAAALIAAADTALYAAKEAGRNRIQVTGQDKRVIRLVAAH